MFVMATGKAYFSFLQEQFSEMPDVTFRAMMGEYVVYYRGRIAGGIYDDRLLVKPVPAARELMPHAPAVIPYPGAQELLLVENVDDRDFLRALMDGMFDQLPEPKSKTKR